MSTPESPTSPVPPPVAAPFLPFLPGLGGIGLAVQLVLSQEAVAQVRSHLQQAEEDLELARTKMASIPRSGAGSFWWAGQLSHHSDLANTRLSDSLVEMTTTLEIYKDGLEQLLKNASVADEQASADALRLAESCTPDDTSAAPEMCRP